MADKRCVLQAAVEQQPVGMRTRNGGSCNYRPPEDVQRRKGNKHITMHFLEQGGYFDVPIQVQSDVVASTRLVSCPTI